MDIQRADDIHQEVVRSLTDWHGINNHREGIHLSDLTSCITKSYWNKISPLMHDEKTVMYFVTGIGLEHAIRKGEDTTSEVIVDGVVGNPDHLIQALNEFIEVKTTRAGIVQDEPKFGWSKEWIRRIAGYSYMLDRLSFGLGTVFLIPARLLARRFVFTREELDLFWEGYIRPRRDVLVEAIEKDLPPQPFAFNEDYECTGCPYYVLCDIKRTEGHIPVVSSYKGDTINASRY